MRVQQYYSWQRLPIHRLIVATNVNDILTRAINKGDYSTGTVTPTITPSMDIQVSSNFERLLFDVGGRDGNNYNYSNYMNVIEVYDPLLNSWSTANPMPDPSCSLL